MTAPVTIEHFEFTIRIASHHFALINVSGRARPSIEAYIRKYIQYDFQRSYVGQITRTTLRVYAAATKNRAEYRLHINVLDDFLTYIEYTGIKKDRIKQIILPRERYENIALGMKPQWIMRDYQIPAVDYIVNKPTPISKFLEFKTGYGKGITSIKSMSDMGVKTIIIVKPMYIEKWANELLDILEIETNEVVSVRGATELKKLLSQGRKNRYKFIIIGNRTLQSYIKRYELVGTDILDQGYACLPDDLFSHLGASYRLIDEVHQDFHMNFKFDLYTHVWGSLALSATLNADDDFTNRMYNIAYPGPERYIGPSLKKHVYATAVLFKFSRPEFINATNRRTSSYDHHEFEKSILKNHATTAHYLDLIRVCSDNFFMKTYKEKQKLLIFCISINMCTKVVDFMEHIYPDLRIGRFVEDDPDSVLEDCDIIVSTVQSSGTARDIAHLATVILTIAISSSQSNKQSLGRLRPLKDGSDTNFIYFVCTDVPKHIEYHNRKKDILHTECLGYRAIDYSPLL